MGERPYPGTSFQGQVIVLNLCFRTDQPKISKVELAPFFAQVTGPASMRVEWLNKGVSAWNQLSPDQHGPKPELPVADAVGDLDETVIVNVAVDVLWDTEASRPLRALLVPMRTE